MSISSFKLIYAENPINRISPTQPCPLPPPSPTSLPQLLQEQQHSIQPKNLVDQKEETLFQSCFRPFSASPPPPPWWDWLTFILAFCSHFSHNVSSEPRTLEAWMWKEKSTSPTRSLTCLIYFFFARCVSIGLVKCICWEWWTMGQGSEGERGRGWKGGRTQSDPPNLL